MNDAMRRYLVTAAAGLGGGAVGGVIVAAIFKWDGDYLGFFGALMGAAATIAAGYIAWQAAQLQIRSTEASRSAEEGKAADIVLTFLREIENTARNVQTAVNSSIVVKTAPDGSQSVESFKDAEGFAMMYRIAVEAVYSTSPQEVTQFLSQISNRCWLPVKRIINEEVTMIGRIQDNKNFRGQAGQQSRYDIMRECNGRAGMILTIIADARGIIIHHYPEVGRRHSTALKS